MTVAEATATELFLAIRFLVPRWVLRLSAESLGRSVYSRVEDTLETGHGTQDDGQRLEELVYVLRGLSLRRYEPPSTSRDEARRQGK